MSRLREPRASLLQWLCSLAIVAGCLVAADKGLLRLPYLEYALLGGWVVWLARAHDRADWIAFGAFSVVLGFLAIAVKQDQDLTARLAGYVLGLSAIATAALRLSRASALDRTNRWETLIAVALVPLFMTEVLLMRRALVTVHAPTYDLYAYALDDRLGGQLSFALARTLGKWPLVYGVVEEVYVALPAIMGVFFAAVVQRSGVRGLARGVLLLFVASILAVVGYLVVPVSGPRFAFAQFPILPAGLPALQRMALPPEVERNGVPSLHLFAALLPWWNVRTGGTPMRLATGAFLVGTFAATLTTGEHYLVDLILTVPFGLAIQVAFFAEPGLNEFKRWLIISAGATLTAFWFVLLRSAALIESVPSVALFALVALSVVLPLLARRTPGLLPGTIAEQG
jgi:hypothetical protein